MKLFKKADQLSTYLATQHKKAKTIGFVPTMGALHAGHLSLITASKKANDITVCSVFVNPTQFNNADDLAKYPVTLEKDIARLLQAECDVLFVPVAEEIYPADYVAPDYDLGHLEEVMEGKFRPGHFQGVSQVVHRLLSMVKPTNLYLGVKDFQQVKVITKLIELTGLQTAVRIQKQPTLREADGLAMSSRNLRLSTTQRSKATAIYRELSKLKEKFSTDNIAAQEIAAVQSLTEEGFAVDYVSITDAESLTPPTPKTKNYVVLVAAYLDDIRLIDNLELTAKR